MSKLEQAIQENAARNASLGLLNVTDLNNAILAGKTHKIIDDAETQMQTDLAAIAQQIASNPAIKIVLLAGPSSSGKTSTTNRLALHLTNHNLSPVILSMDNWFVNRRDTPLDEY